MASSILIRDFMNNFQHHPRARARHVTSVVARTPSHLAQPASIQRSERSASIPSIKGRSAYRVGGRPITPKRASKRCIDQSRRVKLDLRFLHHLRIVGAHVQETDDGNSKKNVRNSRERGVAMQGSFYVGKGTSYGR